MASSILKVDEKTFLRFLHLGHFYKRFLIFLNVVNVVYRYLNFN